MEPGALARSDWPWVPGSACEAVALHHASESPAFGVTDHVNKLAGLEHSDRQVLAHLELVPVVGRDLFQVAAQAAVLIMAGHGFVAAFYLAKPQLNGRVPVIFFGFDLGHDTRTGLYNRHRDHDAVFPEYLAHTYFFAQKSLNHR